VSEPDVRTHGARMTFHGLHHRYAFDRYQEFRAAGFTAAAARLMVSKLIGYSRDDITRIYLAESARGSSALVNMSLDGSGFAEKVTD
jgi:hypothetical protein